MAQPILKLASGALEVAVWENEHDGRKYRSVTCQRSYKDDKGVWQRTQSFPGRDVPILANLLLEAWRAGEVREVGQKTTEPTQFPQRDEKIPF